MFFKHNDMRDLEAKLLDQQKLEVKNPKKAAKTKKFIVAEGIYMNTGEMCPLRELVKLRAQFKCRLILDESVSFGTVGKHGRGVTELLGVDLSEVDLICASLEGSVESVGGFCVGSNFIIEHQRLSGLGYCFSASQPPSLTQAAISALDIFEKDPGIFSKLNEVAEKVDKKFREFTRLELRAHPISAVKHLYLRDDKEPKEAEVILRKISDLVSLEVVCLCNATFPRRKRILTRIFHSQCIKMGLAIVPSTYLPIEKNPPRPSLRVTVNRLLTDDEITKAFNVLQKASHEVK